MLQNLDPINHFFFAFFFTSLPSFSFLYPSQIHIPWVECPDLNSSRASILHRMAALLMILLRFWDLIMVTVLCWFVGTFAAFLPGIFEPCMRRKMPVKLSCNLSLTMEWFFLSCYILPIFYPKKSCTTSDTNKKKSVIGLTRSSNL